jgi:hypothetical protein
MKDKNSDVLLKGTEKAAGEAFRVVVDNLHGKHKAPNYKTHADTMLETFRNMRCNMSLKLHFLLRHLGFSQATMERPVMSKVREISPRYAQYRKMLPREMESSSACQLLLAP